MADSPLTNSLAALAQFFVGDGTVQQTLERVSDLTVEALPQAAMVGITMIVEGRERTAVFTDDKAPELYQAQYDSGDGPVSARSTRAGPPRSTRPASPASGWSSAALRPPGGSAAPSRFRCWSTRCRSGP
jgi:hypothetical protein